MVDTVRTLAALQALLADNSSGDISAQDVRDLLVSVYTGSTQFEVDRPPVTADAMDDEFEDGSFDTGLWTDLNIGSTTKSESQSTLVLTSNENVNQLRAIYQAVPSGDWTIRAKLLAPTQVGSTVESVLFVAAGTTSTVYTVGYWCDGTKAMRTITRASPTDVAAGAGTEIPEAGNAYAYVEIEHDDSADEIYLRWSPTGVDGSFYQLHSVSSFTPAIIGLSCTNRRSEEIHFAFDWFRRIA